MHLTLLLDMAADGFADRCLVGPRSASITGSRLRELATGGAELIRAADADAVVYLAVNGPAFPVALFAAAVAGVPLVPINYRLGAEQLDELLANHPRAWVIADEAQAAALTRVGRNSVTPQQWLEWVATVVKESVEATPSDAPAVIIYTSGTTSKPKGVVLRHENLTSYVLETVEFAGAGEDEAALMSVPPYHIAAVSNVLTNLFAGRRFLTLEAFDPQRWLETVRTEAVTQAMVVPTMLARIMACDGDRSAPSLRLLSYGGAKMPVKVIERALREWPDVGFVNAYGLTETSSTISILGPEEHRSALASTVAAERDRLMSAGKPVPSIELEIRDDTGNLVSVGEPGRIWVRGAQVSGEYTGLGSTVDNEGFFDTRDRGRMDAEGYLFIEGRIDDTIIRGAENIAPAEIEDVLIRHPDIEDAVVVGIPDEEWGQRIEAVVVPKVDARIDTEELRGYVRGLLRGSKTPDRIACWNELPRTVTGKILRRDVVAGLTSENSVL
ncbi:class I adenylate-forming enzyme family protein [Nocardia sp. NPDC052278]|uniref:class I adenylate-forming enzyme family protein n=1 Tax=unclassified Nocardia TaxID=2637762 RepID=UPI0036C3EFF3